MIRVEIGPAPAPDDERDVLYATGARRGYDPHAGRRAPERPRPPEPVTRYGAG